MKRLAWTVLMGLGMWSVSSAFGSSAAIAGSCLVDECTRPFQCYVSCTGCSGSIGNPGNCTPFE